MWFKITTIVATWGRLSDTKIISCVNTMLLFYTNTGLCISFILNLPLRLGDQGFLRSLTRQSHHRLTACTERDFVVKLYWSCSTYCMSLLFSVEKRLGVCPCRLSVLVDERCGNSIVTGYRLQMSAKCPLWYTKNF